jgi:hypothetical protein
VDAIEENVERAAIAAANAGILAFESESTAHLSSVNPCNAKQVLNGAERKSTGQ